MHHGRTEKTQCGACALLKCIVDGFQAQAPTVMRTRVDRAISRGEDARVGSAAELIHRNAVLTLKVRGACELIDGSDADADNDKVGRTLQTILADDGTHTPGS